MKIEEKSGAVLGPKHIRQDQEQGYILPGREITFFPGSLYNFYPFWFSIFYYF